MAEPETGGDGSFGFLTRKVGPLPVYVWALLAVAGYYWYTHYGPGASKSAVPAVATVDQAVQPIGGSQYKSNSEWEAAAINFLVGESIPPDEASTALFDYLHSQRLSPQQEKDVNLAIEGIGPPPNIPAPGPVQKNPPAKKPVTDREKAKKSFGTGGPHHPVPRHRGG